MNEERPVAAEADMVARLVQLNERSCQLLGRSFMKRLDEVAGASFSLMPPEAVSRTFQEFGTQLLSDPLRIAQAQASFWRDSFALWHNVIEGHRDGRLEPVFPPNPADRRFKDKAWTEDPAFVYVQQSYFLMANWMQNLVDKAADADPSAKQRLKFYTRQYLSAMAPSNFPLTNPEVLRKASDTDGRSLLDGLERFLDDLERGDGHLRIRMTDEAKFSLGHNIATTPGQVVFRNDLIELIQYAPTTPSVYRHPVLIVPPWINKYYILDLQPKNSLVGFLVARGFTVFLISWVNPTADAASKRFEDYLREGPLAALDAMEAAIGAEPVNIMGFCIGGILTATGLAHLAATGRANRIASASLLATFFDFTDVGEVGVFVDDAQVTAMEAHTKETGFLAGRHMADMFSMLRENDLIWSFFVNNYLLAKEPAAFDLLYWNGDTTRLPAAMLSDYLRNFYLGNAFARPGSFTVLGTPIDTRKIEVPTYALATKEDHIAPWRSCFPATQQLRGPVRFVLGGSGHVAGIINQATSIKYGYWTNDTPSPSADAWLDSATAHQGSWWVDWAAWLNQHGGEEVPARDPRTGRLKPLGDAPGTYVRLRAEGTDA
ncbi:MAG: class I poly(R)-hydroxyalkanoic acid synthase [Pseudomonadota bacterium]